MSAIPLSGGERALTNLPCIILLFLLLAINAGKVVFMLILISFL